MELLECLKVIYGKRELESRGEGMFADGGAEGAVRPNLQRGVGSERKRCEIAERSCNCPGVP